MPFFLGLTVPEDCKETIFEGVVCGDYSSYYNAHYDRVSLVARQQMKQVQSGTQHAKWKAYKERYGLQTTEIIEGFTQYDRRPLAAVNQRSSARQQRGRAAQGSSSDTTESGEEAQGPTIVKQVPGMFHGKAGLASNWKMGFTSLINGTGYQHPHCDTGRPDSYKGLKIFPFVTIHGFGLNEFTMWLLPDPFSNNGKYGFLHTFKASQMLFMRGDFVHAGVPSTSPRGHMKFFPVNDAGWKRESTFWNRKEWETVTFMWQGYHPIFGYPCTGSPDLSGNHVVTYPVEYTTLLRYPYSEAECAILGIRYEPLSQAEIEERTALKRKAKAQLAYGVFNV
jgi:hypothetical protein